METMEAVIGNWSYAKMPTPNSSCKLVFSEEFASSLLTKPIPVSMKSSCAWSELTLRQLSDEIHSPHRQPRVFRKHQSQRFLAKHVSLSGNLVPVHPSAHLAGEESHADTALRFAGPVR